MKKTYLRIISIVLVLILSCSFAFAGLMASAAAGTIGAKARTTAEIENYVKAHPFQTTAADTFTTPTSVTSPYAVGALSQASKDNALNSLNVIRFIAGLDEVKWDASLENGQQSAALVSAANKTTSFSPAKPAGFDDKIYEAGRTECGVSNIVSGAPNIAYAVLNWISNSDSASRSTVGHRRWCLSPYMGKTCFGEALNNDSTGKTFITMHVTDSSSTTGKDVKNIPWPAQNTPIQYFSKNDVWSFMTGDSYEASAISVKVTRASDNKVWNLSKSSSADGFFTVDSYKGSSYTGLKGDCIIFQPKDYTVNAGDSYSVHIETGKETYDYKVNFFSLNNTSSSTATVSSIAVKTLPSKLVYNLNDTFASNGLTLTATYSDGTKKDVTSGFTTNLTKLSETGKKTVAVTYEGKTASFSIFVLTSGTSFTGKLSPSDKAVSVDKGKTTTIKYTSSQTLPDGYKITAYSGLDNGSAGVLWLANTENSSRTLEIEGVKDGTDVIFVALADSTNNYYDVIPVTITVKTAVVTTLTSVSLKSIPSKTVYNLNETLSTNGLVLNATYSDGSTKEITTGFTTSVTKLSSAGKQAVTVTYEGKSVSFNVYVITASSSFTGKLSPADTSVSLAKGSTTQIKYTSSQALPSGFRISAAFAYNNGVVSAKFDADTANNARTLKLEGKAGGNEIVYVFIADTNGNYYDIIPLKVTVISSETGTVSSITVKSLPNKTIYTAGETLDKSGLVITVNYADGTSKDITTGFEVSPSALTTEGVQTVTVTYEAKTATFNVAVNAKAPEFSGKLFVSESKITLKKDETKDIKISSSQDLPEGYTIQARFSKNDGTITAGWLSDTTDSSRTIQVSGAKAGEEIIYAFISDKSGKYVDTLSITINVVEEEEPASPTMQIFSWLFQAIFKFIQSLLGMFGGAAT